MDFLLPTFGHESILAEEVIAQCNCLFIQLLLDLGGIAPSDEGNVHYAFQSLQALLHIWLNAESRLSESAVDVK